MGGHRLLRSTTLATAVALVCVLGASAGGDDWAAPQIRAVTGAGILGTSPATFAPASKLTQGALAGAIRAADALQHPPTAPAPVTPLSVLSTIAPNATVAGELTWVVDAPGHSVDHVDFAIDGTGVATSASAPFQDALDTRTLAEGAHKLAVNVAFDGGGYAIATWSITVANAAGSLLSPPSGPVDGRRREVLAPRRARGGCADTHALPCGLACAARDDEAARRRTRRLPRSRPRGTGDPGDARARRAPAAREHRHRGGRADARAAPQPPRGAGLARAPAHPAGDASRGRVLVRPGAPCRPARRRRGAPPQRRASRCPT